VSVIAIPLESGATRGESLLPDSCQSAFAGSLDFESTAASCTGGEKQENELLFMALFLQLLKTRWPGSGDRADGCVSAPARPTEKLPPRTLWTIHFLEGVVSLAERGVPPLCGVSTATCLFTKTGRAVPIKVWFYA